MSTSAQEAKERKYKRLLKQGKMKYKTRVFNRCKLTGRSRSYIRYFGLSRIKFRELAHEGLLPGVKKSSR